MLYTTLQLMQSVERFNPKIYIYVITMHKIQSIHIHNTYIYI